MTGTQRIYAVALIASREGVYEMRADILTWCANKEEALQAGLIRAKGIWPPGDGWVEHSVAVNGFNITRR